MASAISFEVSFSLKRRELSYLVMKILVAAEGNECKKLQLREPITPDTRFVCQMTM